MTVALLAVAGLLAAGGTRLAALPMIAAAVLGAGHGGSMVSAATWAPALAAGLLVLGGGAPRRMAVPVLGVSAVLAAGSATNAAVVLVAWVVGSVGAASSRDDSDPANRWAVGLLLSDLPVLVAIGYSAMEGFVQWPQTVGTRAAIALGLSALLKAPLIGSEPGPGYAGLLVVRTQVIVLTFLSLGSAPDGLREAAAAVGAIVFALGAAATPAVRDGVQEAGLVMLAVSTTTLGLSPLGWSWGVLAGGTLIHCLRVRASGTDVPAPLVRLVYGGGGVWLPILPAVAALSAAVVGKGGWPAGVVVAGLAVGLGLRVTAPRAPGPARGRPRSSGQRVLSAATLMLAGAAALWAGLLTLPRPPGADPLPWPPIWAGVIVVIAAAAGLLVPSLAPPREAAPGPATDRSRLVRTLEELALVGVLARPLGVSLLLVLLVVVAVAVWVLGSLRGFL
jgi:hypothetical protein